MLPNLKYLTLGHIFKKRIKSHMLPSTLKGLYFCKKNGYSYDAKNKIHYLLNE